MRHGDPLTKHVTSGIHDVVCAKHIQSLIFCSAADCTTWLQTGLLLVLCGARRKPPRLHPMTGQMLRVSSCALVHHEFAI